MGMVPVVVCTIPILVLKVRFCLRQRLLTTLFYRNNLFKERLYPNLCEALKQLLVDHVVYCAFT